METRNKKEIQYRKKFNETTNSLREKFLIPIKYFIMFIKMVLCYIFSLKPEKDENYKYLVKYEIQPKKAFFVEIVPFILYWLLIFTCYLQLYKVQWEFAALLLCYLNYGFDYMFRLINTNLLIKLYYMFKYKDE